MKRNVLAATMIVALFAVSCGTGGNNSKAIADSLAKVAADSTAAAAAAAAAVVTVDSTAIKAAADSVAAAAKAVKPAKK